MLPCPCGAHDPHRVLHAKDRAEDIGVECRGIAVAGLIATGPGVPSVPALLTTTSSRPKRATVRSTRSRTAASCANIRLDEFGFGADGHAVRRRAPGRPARGARRRQRAHPRCAKATAVARPMPVSAPVIRTTCCAAHVMPPGMDAGATAFQVSLAVRDRLIASRKLDACWRRDGKTLYG